MTQTKLIALKIALIAGGLAFSTGSAFAGCTPKAVGETTDNPEKDTVACDGRGPERLTGSGGAGVAPGQRTVVQIGSPTDNPEKDTFAYAQAPAVE